VAKLINQSEDDLGVETAAGSVVGTPAYMSPEQAGGMPIDGRSDIYSLGAIMYELFCGQAMFRGRSFGEFVRKHLTEAPVPPRATPRGAKLDPRIEGVILRAIEKDPMRRYQSVLELREALLGVLQSFQAGERTTLQRMVALPGESARLPRLGSDHAIPMVEIAMETSESALRIPARRSHPTPAGQFERQMPWWMWFTGGAVAVGLGIGGATWYVRSTSPSLAPHQAALPPMMARPAAATLIELRLSSSPTDSAVYKQGSATELCRTPCLLHLDPEDGTVPVRPFVLSRAGFEDTVLAVDLRGAKREFHVTLSTSEPAPDIAPTASVPEMPDTPTAHALPSKPRGRKEPPRENSKLGDPAATNLVSPGRRSIDADAEPASSSQPLGGTPLDPGKLPGKIDRSETIDPFRTQP
jgi:hypothetical protein